MDNLFEKYTVIDIGSELIYIIKVKYQYYIYHKECETIVGLYSGRENPDLEILGHFGPINSNNMKREKLKDIQYSMSCRELFILNRLEQETVVKENFLTTVTSILYDQDANLTTTKLNIQLKDFNLKFFDNKNIWDGYNFENIPKFIHEDKADIKTEVTEHYKKYNKDMDLIIDKFRSSDYLDGGQGREVFVSQDKKYAYKKCGKRLGLMQQLTELSLWNDSPMPFLVPLEAAFKASDGQLVLVFPYMNTPYKNMDSTYEVVEELNKRYNCEIASLGYDKMFIDFYNGSSSNVYKTAWFEKDGYIFLGDYGEFFGNYITL